MRLAGELTERKLATALHFLDALDADGLPLVISIQSSGGMIYGALEVLRRLEKERARRIIITRSRFASSSAAALFLAGTFRHLSSRGGVGFHAVEMLVPVYRIGPDRLLPKRDYEVGWQLQEEIERLLECRTTLSRDAVLEILRSENGKYFAAAEALRWGIATDLSP